MPVLVCQVDPFLQPPEFYFKGGFSFTMTVTQMQETLDFLGPSANFMDLGIFT